MERRGPSFSLVHATPPLLQAWRTWRCSSLCVCDDCQVMVVSSIMSYDSVVYESYTLGAYTFPHWASVVGWSIAASSMVAVPVTAVYQLITLPAINYRQVSPGVCIAW